MNDIRSKIKESFNFLWKEYGFHITNEESNSDWCIVEAKNQFTGIKIYYEYKTLNINVIIFRLVNGKVIDNTSLAMKNNNIQINCFGIEHVIFLRNPDALPLIPNKEVINHDLEPYTFISDVAKKAYTYCSDLLRGDFSIQKELDSNVKKMYNDYYNNGLNTSSRSI